MTQTKQDLQCHLLESFYRFAFQRYTLDFNLILFHLPVERGSYLLWNLSKASRCDIYPSALGQVKLVK